MQGSTINSVLTIEYMCNEKENQFFDRKSAKKDVKELANHVAGFANASGGTLAIGIADDGKIEGFEDCKDKYNKFLKIPSGDYLKTVPKYENEGCNGGWPWSALDYVYDHGLCTEEAYPYHGRDEECKDSQCEVAVQSKGKVQLPQGDEESLANAVALTPVSIVLDASAMQFYDKGIITKCSENINHAVLAVGYGEEDGIKYWIIKNSWSESWGEKGYCRIEKDVGGMGRCALTYSSVYPTF